jgi:hypothetical protein
MISLGNFYFMILFISKMETSDNTFVFQSFVLYVGTDDCVGSQRALKACETFREDVKVVPVARLSRPLPDWLSGTPTVVSGGAEGMVARRGTEAIQSLMDYANKEHQLCQMEPADEDPAQDMISDRLQTNKVGESDVDELIRQREEQLPETKMLA